ncbi:MAG: ATP-binding cassette domain-containing protein, partial [Bacteroidetes bacterium]|nr:ATP-binding cassette domain-containing protein [Bacteroidota bacterium]
MLHIKNLHARVGDKEILKGLTLDINPGEVHAIMGPNGTGKSTLASIIAGKADYEVTEGEILFRGQNILELSADERAREGIFLAFQYPVEIPGVSTTNFMKAALNAKRKHQGLEPITAKDFLKLMNEKRQLVEL